MPLCWFRFHGRVIHMSDAYRKVSTNWIMKNLAALRLRNKSSLQEGRLTEELRVIGQICPSFVMRWVVEEEEMLNLSKGNIPCPTVPQGTSTVAFVPKDIKASLLSHSALIGVALLGGAGCDKSEGLTRLGCASALGLHQKHAFWQFPSGRLLLNMPRFVSMSLNFPL